MKARCAITRGVRPNFAAELGDNVTVDWAMRYGKPSIEDKLTAMRDAGCERISVMALYPQYSRLHLGQRL